MRLRILSRAAAPIGNVTLLLRDFLAIPSYLEPFLGPGTQETQGQQAQEARPVLAKQAPEGMGASAEAQLDQGGRVQEEVMELKAFWEDSRHFKASEVFLEALEVDSSAEETDRAGQVDLVAADSALRPGSREMVSVVGQVDLADSGQGALEAAASDLVDQAAEAADHLHHRRRSTVAERLRRLRRQLAATAPWRRC